MKGKYFFDTYALIEIYKGNPSYEKYKEGIQLILNKLNILEYIYFLKREGKAEDINEIFNKLGSFCVEYDNDVLKKAAEMKLKYKEEKISFIDCIGYELAKKYNYKFLTGDEKFRNKKNVEFVK